MEIVLAILLVVFLFISPGAKYQVQTPLFSPDARVAIPFVVNRTFKEGLGEVLTAELVDQFMLRSNVQIVSEQEAEFLLVGEVLQYIQEPVQWVVSPTGEYEVIMEVEVSLISAEENLLIWKNRFRESAIYSIFATAAIQTEREAIHEAARKICRDVLNVTLKEWQD